MFCFCSETRSKRIHTEKYFSNKEPCGKFSDMAETATMVIYQKTTALNQRRRLLIDREYGQLMELLNNERY